MKTAPARHSAASSVTASGAAADRRPGITLLVVDDDLLQAKLIAANLARPGRFNVEVVASAQAALERLSHPGIDAVLTDLLMPGIDGVELVRRVRASDDSLPVIVASGAATVDAAVEAMRAGATDFLQKPPAAAAVIALVERAVAERPVREEIARRRARAEPGADRLAGDHPRLAEVRQFAEQVARAPRARVLVTGETGTGKSLLARTIHELSGAVGRFVQVNCAAIPAQLLESELFGHEKGAFTDAKALKRGLVELADNGTIFLDEIDSLPLELQPKLLLFLETRQIRRVGAADAISVAARVVAASNADLGERVRAGGFRRDLLYRLDVAAVEMPPLREMPQVIPDLAEKFMRELCDEAGRPVPEVTPSTFGRLAGYAWPGNARELRNAVERALLFHADGPLEVAPPVAPPGEAPTADGILLEHDLTLETVERAYISAALARGGDFGAVAARLGISRKTLWEKRRRYGL